MVGGELVERPIGSFIVRLLDFFGAAPSKISSVIPPVKAVNNCLASAAAVPRSIGAFVNNGGIGGLV